MSNIGSRIKELRTVKGMTQTDLANIVGLSYIQIGRYETLKSSPSSEVLQKLANALDTTTDFLMTGSSGEVAESQLTDKDLIKHFKAVEKLSQEDKKMIITLIDALLTKRQLQKLAS